MLWTPLLVARAGCERGCGRCVVRGCLGLSELRLRREADGSFSLVGAAAACERVCVYACRHRLMVLCL